MIVELDVPQLSWSGNDLYDAATDGVRSALDSNGSRSSALLRRLERLFLLLDLDIVPIWVIVAGARARDSEWKQRPMRHVCTTEGCFWPQQL